MTSLPSQSPIYAPTRNRAWAAPGPRAARRFAPPGPANYLIGKPYMIGRRSWSVGRKPGSISWGAVAEINGVSSPAFCAASPEIAEDSPGESRALAASEPPPLLAFVYARGSARPLEFHDCYAAREFAMFGAVHLPLQ